MTENKYKILVVDDEPANIEIIIQNFLYTKFQMLAAMNGEMAVMLAETSRPDLIILDWHMPGMSGLDVIKELKSKENTKDIVIIMATAIHTSSENLKQALEEGAFDFLRKPFDKIELEARVKSALNFVESQNKIRKQQENLFKQKEMQLKETIESKKRELITSALQIIRLNEMNQNLIENLVKLLPQVKNVTNKAIRDLINEYKVQIIDNNWNEFETRFKQVHIQFYDNLRKQFPNLTQNEIKICAFLRLNMNVNEISAITYQSAESVRKAKFRLRKKLYVENENDMINLLVKL